MCPDVLAALEEGQDKVVLGGKCRYSVALATPAVSMISSIPTARIPRRENSS
jgi:hypothetical protein